MEIINRKARFNYTILKEIECGIELKGTEIKSLRKGNANITDCYGKIKDNEVYLINMYIGKYEEGNIFNHEERRTRKLLLHKKEIQKLKKEIEQNSYTLVPLKVYLLRGKAKILLGIAKGKKLYDKREAEKEKALKRNIKNMY